MKFHLGRIVATPGVLRFLREQAHSPWLLLDRHAHADWGDLCAEDKQLNDEAIRDGSRILSAYLNRTGFPGGSYT